MFLPISRDQWEEFPWLEKNPKLPMDKQRIDGLNPNGGALKTSALD